MDLPYGWSEQYAIRHLLEKWGEAGEAIVAMSERISQLEAEIARLDMTKANKPGRKPKS